MEFTLNDTTAYGIYNGISQYDIQDMLDRIAKEYELDYFDYSCKDIARTLSMERSQTVWWRKRSGRSSLRSWRTW